MWSKPWTSDGLSDVQHAYQSATDYGVIKAWHLHDVHSDQHTVTRGKLQLVLVDLREDSPTHGQVNSVMLGALKPRLVVIVQRRGANSSNPGSPPRTYAGAVSRGNELARPVCTVTSDTSDIRSSFGDRPERRGR